MAEFTATHIIKSVEPRIEQKFHNPAHDGLIGNRCSFNTAEVGQRCIFQVEDGYGGIHYIRTSPINSVKRNKKSLILTSENTIYTLAPMTRAEK